MSVYGTIMVATPSLGLDITSIGVITSIFPLCYGCSKFVSGVVGDVLSPSVCLGGGLIATGVVNMCFRCKLDPSSILYPVGYERNIARVWRSELCENSHFLVRCQGAWNILGYVEHCSQPWRFAAPILAGTAARTLGWNWGLWAPGLIALVFGTIIVLTLKDSPEARGFEAVEDVKVTATPKPTQEEEANSGEKLQPVAKPLSKCALEPFHLGTDYLLLRICRSTRHHVLVCVLSHWGERRP